MNQVDIFAILRFLITPTVAFCFRIWGLGCKSKRRSIILSVVCLLFQFVLSIIIIQNAGYIFYKQIIAFLNFFSSIIVILLISNDTILKTLFLHFSCMILSTLVSILINVLRHTWNLSNPVTVLIMLVIYAVLLVYTIRYVVPSLRFMADTIEKCWWVLMLVPLIVSIAILGITIYNDNIFEKSPIYSGMMSTLIVSCYFLFVYVLYRNLKDISELSEKLRVNDLMEVQISAMHQRVQMMDEYVLKSRILTHDHRHCNSTVLSLLLQGNTQKAIDLLAGQEKLKITKPSIFCENIIINAIIYYYSNIIKEKNIAFKTDLDIPEKLAVDSNELAILISNLLENAIIACVKFSENTAPYIHFTSKYTGRLFLNIENNLDGNTVLDSNGYPCTNQENHGIGTRSVIALVHKYNGEIEYQVEQKIFNVFIQI